MATVTKKNVVKKGSKDAKANAKAATTKAKAKARAKDDDEDEEESKGPGRRLSGNLLGLSIAETWIAIFDAQRKLAKGKQVVFGEGKGKKTLKKPMTDEEIADFMQDEFDGQCAQAKAEKVMMVRSMYNRGQLRPQGGEAPARPVGEFTDEGDEVVRHRGPREEAPKKKSVKKAASKKAKAEVEDDEDEDEEDEDEEDEPAPKKGSKTTAKVVGKPKVGKKVITKKK